MHLPSGKSSLFLRNILSDYLQSHEMPASISSEPSPPKQASVDEVINTALSLSSHKTEDEKKAAFDLIKSDVAFLKNQNPNGFLYFGGYSLIYVFGLSGYAIIPIR